MKLTINGTCNTTLDDLRIGSSEEPLVGSLTFHNLGLIIAAACALVAILCSLFLIWMHALHYTKPYEQRHIIRILFMVPVYAAASFLSFWFYWHAIYFEVISSCYEAFAIASFFALLCHYIAPDLHEQKAYFRGITPKAWVLPINWFAKCCGGERGPWRTPRSGLTLFNILWTGIYQYCFLRVALTIVAVVTQYFDKYCESSNSPVFAHIWVLVLEGLAVTVAMYCLIQFYVQLRVDLAPHRPFLKVAAIKLVIFLSFWQSFMISILTSSTLKVVEPTKHIAYPDLKIGIPSLLLCIEMAIFSILHLFAFPYSPYTKKAGTEPAKYPLSPTSDHPGVNELGPKQGGVLGVKAIVDAMNPWDMVKGFARGMRWLFVGRRHREKDTSYQTSSFDINNPGNENDMSLGQRDTAYKGTQNLPIADEFRRSRFGLPGFAPANDEGAELLAHAQPNPTGPTSSGYTPARQRYDANGQDINAGGARYDSPYETSPDRFVGANPTPGTVRRQENQGPTIGMAISEPSPYHQGHIPPSQQYDDRQHQERRPKPSEQWANSSRPNQQYEEPPPHQGVHDELWGAGHPPRPRNDNQF